MPCRLPLCAALALVAIQTGAAAAQDMPQPVQTGTETAPSMTPPEGTEKEPNPNAPQEGAPAVVVTGFVDWYYEHNLNRPPRFVSNGEGGSSPVPVQNVLRNFDFKANEIALNLVEVAFQRAPAGKSVGFRVDLNFGKTTDWVHSAEPGGADTYKYIQQAYVTVPLGRRGATLDFGKFVTNHGAEVIETKDNWNYTRGLLFSWAIPYYHAGLRYNQPLNATSNLSVYAVNGWNNVEDNNTAPSLGVMYSTTLAPRLTFVQNYMGGAELTDNNGDMRHLFDTILTYNVTDQTALMLNFDYGRQELPDGKAHWKGIAGYVRHALTPDSSVGARLEYFDDHDGFSTGVSQEVREATLTYEHRVGPSFLTRAELRFDRSTERVFLKRDEELSRNQATLLVGAIASF